LNRWTNEQQEAITTNGCNILVAAAAGAGKTAVLVERIIQKITGSSPVDIDRILVVTFTSAAAAEMRERIGDAISRELEKNPESKNLQRQMALLSRASITTIHSFCLDVIKNNFHTIDLDPDFRIADETEATLIKMETLEELFEDMYEDEYSIPEFLQLVECYGGSRDDKHLKDIVFQLHEFIQSHPWPEKWLRDNTEAFNIHEGTDFGSTAWGRVLIESARIELKGVIETMHRAADIARGSAGLESYLTTINEELSGLQALLNVCCGRDETQSSGGFCCWDAIYNAFSAMEFGRLPRCGKDADKAKQEQVKAARDDAKKTVKKLKEEIFSMPSVAIIEDLRNIYPLIKCLAQLVTEFDQRYAAKKKDKNILDFNDLEHFCLKILTEQEGEARPSKVAAALRERFEEILVDEYQDSNLVQEVILNTISRNSIGIPNFFMVGDVKQSIYRFRQARPELFMGKYNSYSSETGAKNRKILLYKNFRSRNEVVHAVNYIFKQVMSLNLGELDYNDTEALNAGAEYAPLEEKGIYAGGPVELHIIDLSDQDADAFENQESPGDISEDESVTVDSEQEEQLDSIQTEARIVAERIKELVDTGTYKMFDKNTKLYRPVMYRDIVILLRTTRNWSDVFMEELSAQGIPVYADTGMGYFKTVEVHTIMSLLQVIDNPMQDIPLLSVLRSPIEPFSPDELIDIRMCDREASFFEAMKKIAEEGEGTAAEKSRRFLDRLDRWRRKAFHMSTDELIWYLYTDTGYYSYAGAMPGGVQRQANLRILFERARQFEKTSYKGLFNFINFINKLKSSSGDMGSAKILSESENVVRIMSIHKSKGLEFPVVIVSGCGKSFNMQDMNKGILLHHDLGFGPDFVDYHRRVSYPTVPKQALRFKIKLETLSEEMRILYVALTRAREKLILTGTVKNLKKAVTKWKGYSQTSNNKLSECDMAKARCYLDWIGPAVMRHKDCALLREIGQQDDSFNVPDLSSWDVKLWNKGDVLHAKMDRMQEEKDFLKWIEEEMKSSEHSEYNEEISRRLNWRYPYEISARLPAKISVTELKRRFGTEQSEEYVSSTAYLPQLVKKPAFLEESKDLNSSEKGTILHCVMQHIDLGRVKKVLCGNEAEMSLREEINLQIDEMVKNELITAYQAEFVDRTRIEHFFCAPIGLRLLNSDNVRREAAFNIEVKGNEIYKEHYEILKDESILVQGVIDCYFYEKDGIVLLDYKTDYVPYGGEQAIRERYKMQIDYYTLALEKITQQKVKEKYVYLFWNGEILGF